MRKREQKVVDMSSCNLFGGEDDSAIDMSSFNLNNADASAIDMSSCNLNNADASAIDMSSFNLELDVKSGAAQDSSSYDVSTEGPGIG